MPLPAHLLLIEAAAGHDVHQQLLVRVRHGAQVAGQPVQPGVAFALPGFAAELAEQLVHDVRVGDALELRGEFLLCRRRRRLPRFLRLRCLRCLGDGRCRGAWRDGGGHRSDVRKRFVQPVHTRRGVEDVVRGDKEADARQVLDALVLALLGHVRQPVVQPRLRLLHVHPSGAAEDDAQPARRAVVRRAGRQVAEADDALLGQRAYVSFVHADGCREVVQVRHDQSVGDGVLLLPAVACPGGHGRPGRQLALLAGFDVLELLSCDFSPACAPGCHGDARADIKHVRGAEPLF